MLLGLHTICLLWLFRVPARRMFPSWGDSDRPRSDSLPISLWLCARDTLAFILLNHRPWGWGDCTSGKTCCFWYWYCCGKVWSAFYYLSLAPDTEGKTRAAGRAFIIRNLDGLACRAAQLHLGKSVVATAPQEDHMLTATTKSYPMEWRALENKSLGWLLEWWFQAVPRFTCISPALPGTTVLHFWQPLQPQGRLEIIELLGMRKRQAVRVMAWLMCGVLPTAALARPGC